MSTYKVTVYPAPGEPDIWEIESSNQFEEPFSGTGLDQLTELRDAISAVLESAN